MPSRPSTKHMFGNLIGLFLPKSIPTKENRDHFIIHPSDHRTRFGMCLTFLGSFKLILVAPFTRKSHVHLRSESDSHTKLIMSNLYYKFS